MLRWSVLYQGVGLARVLALLAVLLSQRLHPRDAWLRLVRILLLARIQ